MWWPEHPEDSKNLLLSLSAGLIVAMANLGINMGIKIEIDKVKIPTTYWASLIILFILFLICIISYSHIRKNLDTKKSKKKR